MRRTAAGVWFAWRTVWEAWPAGAMLYPLGVVVSAIAAGPASAYALRQIVDSSTMPWVLVPLGALALRAADGLVYGPIQSAASHRTRHTLRRKLLDKSLAAGGLEHLENPAHADSMQIVRTRAWATTVVFSNLPGLFSAGLATAIALVLLATLHPLLVVAAVASFVAGVWEGHAVRDQLEAADRNAQPQRVAARIARLATSAEGAKEVRMLNLSGFLVDEHRRLNQRILSEMLRARRSQVIAAATASLLRGGAVAAGIVWLVVLAGRGAASPGEVAMGLGLLVSGVQSAGGLGGFAAPVADWSVYSRHLDWLLHYDSPVRTDEAGTGRGARGSVGSLAGGIRLDRVSFTYPGTARAVLDDISLSLPAGSTVAVVGENGAGKTTLVKLLCRFYDPDAGRVLVDGHDLRTLDLPAWRASCTGAFQDFVRFHTTAREAVGAGLVASVADRAAIMRAAADVGAAELIDSMPHGLDTQLGREFSEGIELSAGEWQKLALARAAMRDAPLLVILDEPTASLDPVAEHDVFERFVQMSASARAAGSVCLLVSHRFSTIRMADTIVVLHSGRVVERGTHHELIARGGVYAELYELQRTAYS